jgi:GrpB-like predicted nucleotidyltransferase (UPF0157 family)
MGDGRAPTYEESLAAVTLGPPDRPSGTIELADPDPAWPGLYIREAERVRSLLGDDVLLLEHVGSTSVPGLPAKPTIDILLIVPDSSDEPTYAPRLEAAGYAIRIRETDWHEHRMFTGPDTNIHLHVFSPGSPEIERMVGFRDRLREHREEFELYLATKRDLAARDWQFMQQYADAKSAIVEEIIARAQAEREAR